METDTPEQWPADARERLIALERAFADAEHRAQKYAQERDAALAQSKVYQEETHALQRDYASLRLQKGGFGFKSLLFIGMIGTLVGLAGCYLFLRPKDVAEETFQKFREQNQFNLELAISKGEFAQVDSMLKVSLQYPANQPIKPEIEFVRKIAGAAWRRCEK
ncbi:MAG: hypothetical protein LH618_04925 [Saprospiraceae bacterium]|nr:hypothetical protein [Saprospiraceae bacterium]